MKGDQNRKKHGFKSGHAKSYKKLPSDAKNESVCKPSYVRLPKSQHTIVTNLGPGVDVANASRGMQHVCLLRPAADQPSELEAATISEAER